MEISCVRCWGLEKVGVDKTTKHSICKCSAPLNLDWKNCMGNSNAQPGRSLNDLAICHSLNQENTLVSGIMIFAVQTRAYVSYGQWSVCDVLGPTCSQIHRVDQLMIFLHCNASISRAFVAIKSWFRVPLKRASRQEHAQTVQQLHWPLVTETDVPVLACGGMKCTGSTGFGYLVVQTSSQWETVALDVWNIADVSKRFTFFKNTL